MPFLHEALQLLIPNNRLPREVNLHYKLGWQICHASTIVKYLCLKVNKLFWVFSICDCWCKLNYVVKEMQKFVTICKSKESLTVTTKEKVREKGLKKLDQN